MKKIALIAVGALLAFAGLAVAQSVPVPFIGAMNQSDTVQVIPLGQPSAQSVYAPSAALGGVQAYNYSVPVTAFSLTVPRFVSDMYINPAGTLATGTFTMMANPADGQRACFQSTQTQTAVTITANTGQTISSAGLATITAMTANTRYCWFYVKSLAAWIRFV